MKIFVSEPYHNVGRHTINVAIPNVYDRAGQPGFLVFEFSLDEDARHRIRAMQIEHKLPQDMHEEEWPDDKAKSVIDGFYAMVAFRWEFLHR